MSDLEQAEAYASLCDDDRAAVDEQETLWWGIACAAETSLDLINFDDLEIDCHE